jgi:hypothetical protein
VATDSKKHHFVPQSILRRFSIDGTNRQIFVFDKKKGEYYRASIQDTGSENGFNVLETTAGTMNFEPLFEDIDNRGALMFNRIITDRCVGFLDDPARRDLADIIAVQLLRTKPNFAP